MCVPVIEPNVTLSDEDRQRIMAGVTQAAAPGGQTANSFTPPKDGGPGVNKDGPGVADPVVTPVPTTPVVTPTTDGGAHVVDSLPNPKDPNKPIVETGNGPNADDPNGGNGPSEAQLLAEQLQDQLAQAQQQRDLLNQQIAAQAQGFQSTTQGILQAQQMAQDALRGNFLDLTEQQQKALDASDQLRKNTGQASRKPNYGTSLKANAGRNRNGISSTMLTGTGGVATNTLSLGRPALLGGS